MECELDLGYLCFIQCGSFLAVLKCSWAFIGGIRGRSTCYLHIQSQLYKKKLYKDILFAFNIYLFPTFWPFRKLLKHSVLKARDVELRSGLLLSVGELHHLGGGRALVQLGLANPRPLSAVLKDLTGQMRNILMWQKRQQKSYQTWESTGGTGSGLQKVSSQVRSVKDKLQVWDQRQVALRSLFSFPLGRFRRYLSSLHLRLKQILLMKTSKGFW